MISLITTALQEATGALGRDDMESYALHTGKAGGVAAAVGTYGIKALAMCDDISDAYETGNSGFTEAILAEATARLENPDSGAAITETRTTSWPEYGAALNQAAEAKSDGNRLRYALMTGFVSGLMFNDPGPGHPDHGTVLDAVNAAYTTGSDEALTYAQAGIGFRVRHTDPTPFMPDAQYARYREERLRMMRWLRNFGLRGARTADEAVALPGSMRINHVARQQAQNRDATVYINSGITKMERGNYGEAITDFDRAIELEPDNAGAYSHRGSAKSHVGDIEGAIADFDHAIEIDADDVGAYVSRAISKQHKDDHQGAIADWNHALELKPDDGGWYVNRGMVKEIIGDYDGAIADYNRAAEVEPDYEVAYIARAYIKRKQGDYEGAIADYDRVIELWPDDAAEYSDRAFAKSQTGDYAGAIADYDQAIELRPDDVALHIERGLIKSGAGNHDSAVADFGRARDLAKGRTEG